MEDGHKLDGGPVGMREPLPADFGDGGLLLEDGLIGGGTGEEDVVGLDEGDLGIEVGAAGGHFRGVGFSVLGWPAFDSIADIDIDSAVDANGGKDLGEELAGSPDEGDALFVFLLAGAFADEEELGLGITVGEDGVGARAVEGAEGAVGDGGLSGLQGSVSGLLCSCSRLGFWGE